MTFKNSISKKTVYFISALIFIVGLILFLLFVFSSYEKLGNELIQLNVPGRNVVSFEKPGKYALFEENESEQENSQAVLSKYLITITDINSNNPVTLEVPSAKDRYSYKGRKGVKIYEYQIATIGNYEFSSNLIDQKHGNKTALIVDKGFSKKRAGNVVKAQALLLFPTVLALVVMIYGYLKK